DARDVAAEAEAVARPGVERRQLQAEAALGVGVLRLGRLRAGIRRARRPAQVADGDLERHFLAVAPYRHRYGAADFGVGHQAGQPRLLVDRLAAERQQHVSDLDAGFVGRRP